MAHRMSDINQIWETFRGYLEEMKATVDSLSEEDKDALGMGRLN